ncbi:hypothetical protein Hanom_Chr06g00504621 [Helianthus anomalus]
MRKNVGAVDTTGLLLLLSVLSHKKVDHFLLSPPSRNLEREEVEKEKRSGSDEV